MRVFGRLGRAAATPLIAGNWPRPPGRANGAARACEHMGLEGDSRLSRTLIRCNLVKSLRDLRKAVGAAILVQPSRHVSVSPAKTAKRNADPDGHTDRGRRRRLSGPRPPRRDFRGGPRPARRLRQRRRRRDRSSTPGSAARQRVHQPRGSRPGCNGSAGAERVSTTYSTVCARWSSSSGLRSRTRIWTQLSWARSTPRISRAISISCSKGHCRPTFTKRQSGASPTPVRPTTARPL